MQACWTRTLLFVATGRPCMGNEGRSIVFKPSTQNNWSRRPRKSILFEVAERHLIGVDQI